MKYAGVVVLYYPSLDVVNNVKSYINDLECLYIVDNTPNCDNSTMFKKLKKVKYIRNNENLGIACALNIAAKKAIADGYDWLLTMDQDSHFEKNSVKDMQTFIEKIYSDKYFQKVMGCDYEKLGIVSPFHRTIRTEGVVLKGFDRPLIVMTSGNFINLKIYKKIGGFKDWLFIDAVDFDYCLNLRKNGYEIFQLHYSILNHSLGDMIKKRKFNKTFYADNHSYIRRYYIVRNRYYINDMYKDLFPAYCKAEINCTKKELIKIWLFEKDKIKKTKYMLKGYLDYKKGIRGAYGNKKGKN